MSQEALTLAKIIEAAEDVRQTHLYVELSVLPSNPVLNAVNNVYEKLVDGIKRLSIEGHAAFEQAKEEVVKVWEEQIPRLKDRVDEALVLFQKMISDLIRRMMETIAGAVPIKLDSAGGGIIDSISYKMSLAVSPSVAVAAQEVFRLAVSGGLDVQIQYKFVQIQK